MTTKPKPKPRYTPKARGTSKVRGAIEEAKKEYYIIKEQRGSGFSAVAERQLEQRLGDTLESIDETLEKVGMSLEKLGIKKSEIRTSISEGVQLGIKKLKRYATETKDNPSEDAFRDGLRTFVTDAKETLDSQLLNGRINALSEYNKNLQKSVDDYISASNDLDEARKMNKGDLALNRTSVDQCVKNAEEKWHAVEISMSKIEDYKTEILNSASELAEIHSSSKLAGEARTAFADSGKESSTEFIHEAKSKDYTPELAFAAEEQRQQTYEDSKEKESNVSTGQTATGGTENLQQTYEEPNVGVSNDSASQVTSTGIVPEFEKMNVSGKVTTSWAAMAEEYYESFTTEWLSNLALEDGEREEFNEKLADSMEKFRRTHSVADAMVLTQTINFIWLEKTDTISNDTKADLQERLKDASTLKEVTNISREALARHINYYKNPLIDEFYKGAKEAVEENFDKMNGIFTKNMLKPAGERDFSGNDIMWDSLFWLSFDMYRRNRLPSDQKAEGVTTIPPIQMPDSELGIPPLQATTDNDIKEESEDLGQQAPEPEGTARKTKRRKRKAHDANSSQTKRNQQTPETRQNQKEQESVGNTSHNIGETRINEKSASTVDAEAISNREVNGATQGQKSGDSSVKQASSTENDQNTQTQSIASASDAKAAYKDLVEKGTITAYDYFYAYDRNGSIGGKIEDITPEQSAREAPFVVFRVKDSNMAYAFPNPNLSFNANEFRSLFPNLTEKQFNESKESIEPVLINMITRGWEPASQ